MILLYEGLFIQRILKSQSRSLLFFPPLYILYFRAVTKLFDFLFDFLLPKVLFGTELYYFIRKCKIFLKILFPLST